MKLSQDTTLPQPELMLKQLFEHFRKLKTLMIQNGYPNEHQNSVEDLMRMIHVSRELYNKNVIAVSGLQGVGKTFFLRNMYGLDKTWLRDNEGRGEKLPVLVLERDDINEPYGVIQRLIRNADDSFSVSEERIEERQEFIDMISRNITGNMLPKLYVPKRFFTGSGVSGFLLLPGYEKQREENKVWQSLMRHALISASMVLVITNTNTLARAENREIARDLHQFCLDGTEPIVVYSFIDEKVFAPDSAFEKVKDSFGVKNEDQIVFVGNGSEEYMELWRTKIINTIDKYNPDDSIWRIKQLTLLKQLISENVSPLFDKLSFQQDSQTILNGRADECKNARDCFDSSKQKLRREFECNINNLLKNRCAEASKLADDEYDRKSKNFNGVWKRFSGWTGLDNGKYEQTIREIIEKTWKTGDNKFQEDYFALIRELSFKKLKIHAATVQPSSSAVLKRIGYESITNSDMQNDAHAISPEVMENFGILFTRTMDDRSSAADKNIKQLLNCYLMSLLNFIGSQRS